MHLAEVTDYDVHTLSFQLLKTSLDSFIRQGYRALTK
jgi:hypothetical protein